MIHIGVLSPVAGGFFFGEVLAGIVREVAAAGVGSRWSRPSTPA